MFTVFSLLKQEPLTLREKRYLAKLLTEYSQTGDGAFLQSLSLQNISFCWCEDMNVENGIMGAFSIMQPNTIFLQKADSWDFGPMQPERVLWLELLFTTVVHELRHLWQFRNNPVLYMVCCLPVVRNFTIERDAVRTAQKSDSWIAEWTRRLDSENFQERVRLLES